MHSSREAQQHGVIASGAVSASLTTGCTINDTTWVSKPTTRRMPAAIWTWRAVAAVHPPPTAVLRQQTLASTGVSMGSTLLPEPVCPCQLPPQHATEKLVRTAHV